MWLSAVCANGTEAEVASYARRVAGGFRPPIQPQQPEPVQALIEARRRALRGRGSAQAGGRLAGGGMVRRPDRG